MLEDPNADLEHDPSTGRDDYPEQPVATSF